MEVERFYETTSDHMKVLDLITILRAVVTSPLEILIVEECFKSAFGGTHEK